MRFNVTLALAPSFRDAAGGAAHADPRACAGRAVPVGGGLCLG